MSLFGGFGTTNTNTSNTTGGNIFGANPNPTPLQAQPTQPSLFGSTTTTTPSTGGGLFGSTNTNPNVNTTGGNAGGSAFGGGAFGATNTQGGNTTGGGLFGAPAAPATGASLFSTTPNTGAANTNTGGIFGNNANTGGSLFGNAGQTAQNNPAATGTGGGLFGGGTTNTTGGLFGGGATTNTNTNTGGGLFGGGASINTNTGGGLFGPNTQQPTTNTGGGLFGSNTQQPATTGSSLFGNTQTGGSLFGAKPAGNVGAFGAPASNTTPGTSTLLGGSLFGQLQQGQQPQQQQQQQQPSSFFGSTSGNLFGQPAAQQPNTTLTASALGPPSNLLASRSTAGTQQNSTDPNVQFAKTAASIEAIYNAWNPASPACRFQTHFYNIVEPSKVSLYGRPPNATNDVLWEKAVRENPDPSCLVPVIAIGFDNLRERIDAQTTQATAQTQKLADLQSRLAALGKQHAVTNTSRLLRAAAMQTQLAQRVMRFVQHLHLLIPAVRSSALRPQEEKLRGMLEELEEEIRRARVKSRLNELWALIGAVGASAERANNGGGSGPGSGGPGEWAVVDEEGLAQIAQILGEQQAGLQYLTKILQKGQKDLGVILGNSSAAKDAAEDFGMPVDSSDWASGSTLRASALR